MFCVNNLFTEKKTVYTVPYALEFIEDSRRGINVNVDTVT